ncbi:hypothetical protein FS837_000644 [Tulasnella sp. UAMH 9824]|nr:hypothetical protein FS837_000644 [Tulasnella sp. UAMH 9824]
MPHPQILQYISTTVPARAWVFRCQRPHHISEASRQWSGSRIFERIRYPTYDGPITDVTSNDVICNGGPNPLVKPFSKTVINVPAGATVQAEWHHVLQPNGYDPSDKADPIDPSHIGPTIAYLAKVPDATQESVTGLRWFKIQEDGFDGTTWGVQRMIAAKGLHTIKIPPCIPPGNHFLRAEVIALHAASSYPGAQLYMECAQINITGGGSANPSTVSFPGAYKGTDPGIKYNLYNGSKTYTIPGPPVFTCSGDNSGVSDQSDFRPDYYYVTNHY